MHEARLCVSLLRLAEAAAAREGGARIVALTVEIGHVSGVVPEALAGAFPIAAHGTRADGAALHLRPVPGRDLVLRELEVV